MKCRERSCVFLVATRGSLCPYHIRLFDFAGTGNGSSLADADHFGFKVGRAEYKPRDGEAHAMGGHDVLDP